MTDLERQLTQLGHELDWPPAPDLADSVRERLAQAPPASDRPAVPWRRRLAPVRRRPAFFTRSFAIAIAALLLLAGGVVAAVPSVRHSVLEFFGLRGATVERREQLLAAIERLPGAAREAISCRYLLDLSEEETAAALDCPRGTVKSRLSRALDRLRVELGEEVQA